MGLRLKFNLILMIVFAAGFLTVGVVAQRYLERQAIDDAQRASTMVLDAASFANLDPRIATALGSRIADMKVREFSLGDAQSGVEAEVAQRIKNPSGQVSDIFTTTTGDRRLVTARIVRVEGPVQHVRLVNVDLLPVLTNAKGALYTLLSSIGAVFFAVFFALNLMLDRMIVRPVAEMARQADAVSIGDFSIPEFVPASKDEVGVLGVAFNRMRRSTEEAIKLLKAGGF
jgi:HAMP domain-containing protein